MKTNATESNTIPSVDEAIPTAWARNYVTCSIPGVFLAPAYIDINDGNVTDGILFSQVMYWHKPNSEGQVRLSHKRNGFYWLTKSHRDWFRETRIHAETAREALYRIRDRGLIFYELPGKLEDLTSWLRINWEEFERRFLLWSVSGHDALTEETYDEAIKLYTLGQEDPLTTPQHSPSPLRTIRALGSSYRSEH